MLAHGSEKLQDLAASCVPVALTSLNGWKLDVWDMTPADVDLVVEVYQAVTAANITPADPVVAQLSAHGVNLPTLLAAPGSGMELITRSDIAEYAAAASMMANDGYTHPKMHMPNVPKMSRRKSDSGVDIFNVDISAVNDQTVPLDHSSEKLGLASVKHTLKSPATALRRAIANSLSTSHELTPAYLAAQLRVVQGRLLSEGVPTGQANRVFLFMADFPDAGCVGLSGVAVVEPHLRADMINQLSNLPTVAGGGHTFRIVTFPGLDVVHIRCP